MTVQTTFVGGISPFGLMQWTAPPAKTRPLAPQLQRVFDWIQRNPGGRASHAGKELGLTLPNASKAMLRLHDKQLVSRSWCMSGTDKFYVYEAL